MIILLREWVNYKSFVKWYLRRMAMVRWSIWNVRWCLQVWRKTSIFSSIEKSRTYLEIRFLVKWIPFQHAKMPNRLSNFLMISLNSKKNIRRNLCISMGLFSTQMIRGRSQKCWEKFTLTTTQKASMNNNRIQTQFYSPSKFKLSSKSMMKSWRISCKINL